MLSKVYRRVVASSKGCPNKGRGVKQKPRFPRGNGVKRESCVGPEKPVRFLLGGAPKKVKPKPLWGSKKEGGSLKRGVLKSPRCPKVKGGDQSLCGGPKPIKGVCVPYKPWAQCGKVVLCGKNVPGSGTCKGSGVVPRGPKGWVK